MSHEAFLKGEPEDRATEDTLSLLDRAHKTGKQPSHAELVGARLSKDEFAKFLDAHRKSRVEEARPDLSQAFQQSSPTRPDLDAAFSGVSPRPDLDMVLGKTAPGLPTPEQEALQPPGGAQIPPSQSEAPEFPIGPH